MTILRRIVLVLASGLFALSLWALALDIGLVRTFGKPEPVKKILADSGIYDNLVTSVLDQTNKERGGPGESSEVPLTDVAIKNAAERAITPAFLQQNVEAIIDSVYKWLDGKTTQPEFTIDLAGVKAELANYAAQDLQERLSGLPACPASTPPQNFDAYNATCLPKGVTTAAAAEQVKNDISGSQDFLGDTTITAADIKSPDGNQPIFSGQLKEVPKAYQGFKASPFYLAILAVVAGLGVILLSNGRRKGIRRVGITLLTIGILVLLFAWAINYGSSTQISKINLENEVLKDKLTTLAKDLGQNIGQTFYIVGGAYAGVGALAISGTIFIGRGRTKPEPAAATVEEKTVEPTPTVKEEHAPEPKPEPKKEKPAKPVAKPKPKPTVRKIKVS